MPKRVIDAEAAWGSSKLAHCREEFIPEYTWLYGLADANGNFELSDMRVIHGKVAAIRPHFSINTLRQVFDEFHRHGLLYIWEERGKKYGHWTGSNKPGRLPPKSQRDHYPKLEVRTPTDEEIQKYWNDLDAAPKADTLSLFAQPVPVPVPAAVRENFRLDVQETVNGHVQAARANDGSDLARLREEKWKIFWDLYENKLDEEAGRVIFDRIPINLLDDVIASLLLHKSSSQWKQGTRFIPKARNFLQDNNWQKEPPKENGNGKRILGPAGRTREDQLERMRKNAKTLGLDRP
jgi:hypothetical protein